MSIFEFWFLLNIGSWSFLILKIFLIPIIFLLITWLCIVVFFKFDKRILKYPINIRYHLAVSKSLAFIGLFISINWGITLYYNYSNLNWISTQLIVSNSYAQLFPNIFITILLIVVYQSNERQLNAFVK